MALREAPRSKSAMSFPASGAATFATATRGWNADSCRAPLARSACSQDPTLYRAGTFIETLAFLRAPRPGISGSHFSAASARTAAGEPNSAPGREQDWTVHVTTPVGLTGKVRRSVRAKRPPNGARR
jgi:hypothetical protein